MSEPLLYCPRCDDAVTYTAPWSGWGVAWWGWVSVIALLAVLFPMLASDFCVLIPSMMAIIVAGGPLYRLRQQKPVCRNCSLELEPGRGGSKVRPKPVG